MPPFMKNNNYKVKLRKEIQKLRDSLTVSQREKKSKIIADRFIKTSKYINAKNILIYYPFRSEVDTTIIIERAIEDNKNIVLPKVDNNKLKLFFVDSIPSQLEKGSYNIMEPIETACKEANIKELDLLVVPGVGFDKNFNRLGYGGGFYDRLLSDIKGDVKKIALCFDLQLVAAIPTSEHDLKVDAIITESKEYYSW